MNHRHTARGTFDFASHLGGMDHDPLAAVVAPKLHSIASLIVRAAGGHQKYRFGDAAGSGKVPVTTVMYRLLFQDAGSARAPFVSQSSRVIIGRAADAQLHLVDSGVSEQHACIERRAGGYFISDLGSATGIRVNHERVKEQRLLAGDELEIGSVRLRFEVIHGVAASRQSADPMQIVASVIVGLVILGQIGMFAALFQETRPRNMRLDTTRGARFGDTAIESAEPEPPPLLAANAPVPVATPAPPPAASLIPSVLNRMIRITRVSRADSGDKVTLTILAKAQVGERELDASATAICVQFAALDAAGRSVSWMDPLWLPIPRWENFSTKSFTARFSGPPRQLVGYVVRTYYRNEMQDVSATPPTLQPIAPKPVF